MKPIWKRLIILAIIALLAAPPLILLYGYWQARRLTYPRTTITLDRLPGEFDGILCAFITDVHHGSYLSLDRVNEMVDQVNAAKPDLILLGGDYVYDGPQYIRPCLTALGRLSAPMGVYAVLGNHDHWEDADLTRRVFDEVGIRDLTNTNVALGHQGARIWVCGVGDLWTDTQDLPSALAGIPEDGLRILLSHNPDYAESIIGQNVDLVLSGHTHGGQVSIPFRGPILSSSRDPKKYSAGLIHNGPMQVFVSRGIGTIVPAIRLNCPAEVNLITLKTGGKPSTP